MTDLIPAELLEKGAAYIEEHGLHQGAYWPRGVDMNCGVDQMWEVAQRHGLPVCAMGSVLIAGQGDRPSTTTAFIALTDHLPTTIPTWNDEPSRTAAEVADAMRACATNLRSASGE